MSGRDFKFDFSESFEHLARAPIVEAVVHWRARAEKELNPQLLLDQLKAKLPDYPNSQRQHEIGVETQFTTEGEGSLRQHHHWHGFRFETTDKLQVAQYTRNGFVFSRLRPYQQWATFEAEAKRLWNVYRELAEPSEIQRLGVRFINLIEVADPNEVENILTLPPRGPQWIGTAVSAFLHQTKFTIPDHPYELNIVQTIQAPVPPERESYGLILDLDVGTTRATPFDEIDKHLLQMHWIKNKAFFSLLTGTALEQFRSDEA